MDLEQLVLEVSHDDALLAEEPRGDPKLTLSKKVPISSGSNTFSAHIDRY